MSKPRRLLLQRNVSGYGFELEGEYPCVVSGVQPLSLAELKHIHCGDILLSVNGIDVSWLPLQEVSALINSSMSPIELEFLPADTKEQNADPAEVTSRPPSELYTHFLSNLHDDATSSEEKLTALVQYAGKLSVSHQIVISQMNLTRNLLPLKHKVDEKLSEGIKLSNIALFEASHDRLLIRFTSKTLHYSGGDIMAATVLDGDRRYFYMIMRAPDSRQPLECSSGATNYSCFLFRCLPPSLLGHRSHTELVTQFKLTCHRDRLTGICAEFPRNAESVLRVLRHVLTLPRKMCINLMETPSTRCRSDFVPMHAASTRCTRPAHRNTRQSFLANRDSLSDVGMITPHLSMVTPTFKHPTTASRTSASRIFGKLSKAAVRLRDRWLDRRGSAVQAPTSPYAPQFSRLTEQRSSLPSPAVAKSSQNSLLHSSSLCGLRESTEDYEMKSTVDTDPSNQGPPYLDIDYFINNPAATKSFRAFLLSEYSSENLDFWQSIRDWRAQFSSSQQASESARIIFHTFIDPNSPSAVNVDQHAVKQASIKLSCPSVDMFAEAERQVYQMMKTDSFPRFLDSQFYRSFIASLPQKATTEKENSSMFTTSDSVTANRTPKRQSTRRVSGRLSTQNSETTVSTPTCRVSLDKMLTEETTPVPRLRSACRSWSTKSPLFVSGYLDDREKQKYSRVLRNRSNLAYT